MSDTRIDRLDLASIGACMPGLLSTYASVLANAASVCLEEEGHRSGTPFVATIDSVAGRRFTLAWPPATDAARRTWADPDEATEQGACALAALLVNALDGLIVVHRSWKGSGFDYWLDRPDGTEPLFQNKIRLEVSGLRRGPDSEIRASERQKRTQVRRLETERTRTLPAIIVIVEFGTPQSRFART